MTPTASTAPAGPFRHAFQTFTWANDEWDIAKLIADLDAGRLRLQKDSLDRAFIETYARQVLALDKSRPAPSQGGPRTISLLMSLDLDEALKLPAEALQEPVIMLETRKGRGLLRLNDRDTPDHVLADGQHRVAKAYYQDVPKLNMYVLSARQSNKYRLR